MTTNQPTALGFRVHSGWACVVAVRASAGAPIIAGRWRIEITARFKQPFHAAEGLSLAEAEDLIESCRESSVALATRAVSDIVAEPDNAVSAAAILFASGHPLPELAAVLRSHALIHTAEGEFFREAVVRACENCSLRVARVKERELARVDMPSPGPPWRQDHKLAASAAWEALTSGSWR